ncbi:MAG TPA: hypothetical protein VHB47_07585 [Thermoanaerobaculia bacterium]|nr:hypothetical protein [Thermoanaerobaculia bacterium]
MSRNSADSLHNIGGSNHLEKLADIPVVVRLAGLSALALAPFGDPRLLTSLAEMESRRQRLDALRVEAVERLFRRLPVAEAAERRFLLALKRDCHNQRPILRHGRHALWPSALARIGDVLERIAALEQDLAERERAFRSAYAGVRERERQALFEPLARPSLRRGLALASPALLEGLARHGARPLRGRRARRLEISLLRYLSRAALKLSPYSTLTPLALADLCEGDGGGAAIRYVAGPRRERSLVRIKRYLLDQCCRLLVLHPRVRERLRVGLNPSLERLPGGDIRFLRPPRLQRSAAGGAGARLEKVAPAQVTARLGGDLAAFVLAALDGADLPLRALLEAAAERLGGGDPRAPERFAEAIEQLLDLGVLELRPPWPGYEPSLEGRLLQFLDALPAESMPEAMSEAMSEIVGALRELVELEQSFATADDPAATARRMDDRVRALYDAIATAVEPRGHRPLTRREGRVTYEDVFLEPLAAGRPSLLRLDRRPLRRALDAGDLVWRLGYLFEPRHDALLALEHHLGSRHADRRQVPVVQLFAETRGLWTAYRRHLDERRPGPFDPEALPAVAGLEALRAAVRRGLPDAVTVEGEAERLEVDGLRSLLGGLPAWLLPPVACCLHLQPCDARGETWVANGSFEGTGRMSCRFNVLLDPASRERCVDHYSARSVGEQDGEPVELVDMLFTQGNTVNVHWPQTRRILLLPGETVDLPPARVLRLADLVVERRASPPLRLLAPDGRRIVPCFLSPLDVAFMPTVLRFLDLFGVHAATPLPLPDTASRGDGWTRGRRRMIDNLVVARRRWTIDAAAVPMVQPGAAAFAGLNRWRCRLGLPDQVYLLEKEGPDEAVGEAVGETWKPQYVDFRSPSFTDLLAGACDHGTAPITLVEALPRPQDFPLDPETGPRTFEVVLESLAMAP